jgi:asparagine synthase (glutamine-hydrolysing)
MSAIAGLYRLTGQSVEPNDMGRMINSLAHRGPEGARVWCEAYLGLGHQMLWTTPESLHEILPLVDRTGNFVITADARVDNRTELFGLLNILGQEQAHMADSELILRAYQQWGDRCLDRLIGDFAFVIWDKSKQILFCARDHFGVKPFYYFHSPHTFAFATEIKALLSLSEVPRKLNEIAVGDYLSGLCEDKTTTFYQDILRLAPGHWLAVGDRTFKIQSYWSLDRNRELHLNSNEEYEEAFREVFTEAVQCRLRSAFPLGSTLSGGLDSSSVTCIARDYLVKHNQPQLHTFSAIFDTISQCDERTFVETVLAQGNLKSHYIYGDQISTFTEIDRTLWHQDQPFLIPNLFLFWAMYRTAQQQGVRVMLDGHDGDTVISHGFLYLNELFRKGQWFKCADEINQLAHRLHTSPWKCFKRYGLAPLEPTALRKWRQRSFSAKPALNPILNPDFSQRINLENRLKILKKNSFRPAQTARESHFRGITSGLNTLAMEVADAAAGAFNVELRHPFFDKRLAEFCLALPGNQKLGQGWTRLILRRSMTNILPLEVQWRTDKANLSANFAHGLITLDRSILEEAILVNSKQITAYVDRNNLEKSYTQFISQKIYNGKILELWATALLATWLGYEPCHAKG